MPYFLPGCALFTPAALGVADGALLAALGGLLPTCFAGPMFTGLTLTLKFCLWRTVWLNSSSILWNKKKDSN